MSQHRKKKAKDITAAKRKKNAERMSAKRKTESHRKTQIAPVAPPQTLPVE